jgi:hypothetical protein
MLVVLVLALLMPNGDGEPFYAGTSSAVENKKGLL